MKSFLLTLFPNLTAKAAITAAVCVTAGAAATATVTTVVYQQKSAKYQETIRQLEAEQSLAEDAATGGSGSAAVNAGLQDANVRIVDGMLQVWNGNEWEDYGTVDEVESKDPFYENREQKEATEKSVAQKKLAERGLTYDEEGKIVKIQASELKEEDKEALADKEKAKEKKVLVGTIASESVTNGKRSAGGAKAAGTGAVLPGTPVISSIPQTTNPAAPTTVTTWTNDGGGGSDSGGSSDDGGSSSYSAPSSGGGGGGGGSTSNDTPVEEPSEDPTPVDTGEGGGFDEEWSSEEM
ncbi:MAG: hypothetical protein IKR47_06575 [Lachnospiraceae bacterium]|nr:hypothetical protein [Lachnospiraceae bacterium]